METFRKHLEIRSGAQKKSLRERARGIWKVFEVQEQKRAVRTRYGCWKRNKDAAETESDIRTKTWPLNLVTRRSASTLELHCLIQ